MMHITLTVVATVAAFAAIQVLAESEATLVKRSVAGPHARSDAILAGAAAGVVPVAVSSLAPAAVVAAK